MNWRLMNVNLIPVCKLQTVLIWLQIIGVNVCRGFQVSANEPTHEIMDRRPAKAQASLRIRAVSPEPLLCAHMKYGSIQRVRSKIRHLAPLHGCACAFEE